MGKYYPIQYQAIRAGAPAIIGSRLSAAELKPVFAELKECATLEGLSIAKVIVSRIDARGHSKTLMQVVCGCGEYVQYQDALIYVISPIGVGWRWAGLPGSAIIWPLDWLTKESVLEGYASLTLFKDGRTESR